MGDREILFLPTILISSFSMINHLSSFLVSPAFVNLEMKFLLRGEGCNTPCYSFPNHLH
jgi:hypothetical protein